MKCRNCTMAREKKRPKSDCGNDPFDGLNIASHSPLDVLETRSKCAECGASRKYFCYTCYLPVPELEGKLPIVKLPLQVDVIKHAREVDGKSTAVHAAVLAPRNVTIYTYPCIPDYEQPEKVVLVYPSTDAASLDELAERVHRGGTDTAVTEADSSDVSGKGETSSATHKVNHKPVCPFNRVVFIDSTWSQSSQIYRDERLRDLECVILQERKTCFWRGQDKPDTYLATIEAIYYFMVDYQRLFELTSQTTLGCYDNLLYFYSFMYSLVHRDSSSKSDDAKRMKSDKEKANQENR